MGLRLLRRLNVWRAVTSVIESFRSIRLDATPTKLWGCGVLLSERAHEAAPSRVRWQRVRVTGTHELHDIFFVPRSAARDVLSVRDYMVAP